MKMADQFGNDLRVGVGLKLESVIFQVSLHILVVGDDAVMNDNEVVVLSGPLGMRIHLRRYTMGCPTGMSNADVHVMRSFQVQVLCFGSNLILEGLDLTLFLYQNNGVVGFTSINSNACKEVIVKFEL